MKNINIETIIEINKVIERDTLESSYKLALLKSLIIVIKKFDHHIINSGNYVKIPFYFIIEEWFFYYIPFVFLNIRQHKSRNLVLNSKLEKLYKQIFDQIKICKEDDWKCIYALIYKKYFSFELDVDVLFRELRRLIISNPMKFMGESEYYFFPKDRIDKIEKVDRKEFQKFGYFEIRKDMYLALKYLGDNFYGLSTILYRWEDLLKRINKFSSIKEVKEILTHNIENIIRDTSEIKELFQHSTVYCVWTGKKIKDFNVDHLFPFSIFFNNDYWNLLPTDSIINNRKRDKIPSPNLIEKAKERILFYWEKYKKEFKYFDIQRKIALGSFEEDDKYINQIKNKSAFMIEQLGYMPFEF